MRHQVKTPRSGGYARTLKTLKSGYKLAYDDVYVPNGRRRGQQGCWWLTSGVGPILTCDEGVAKRLIHDGAVKEWRTTEDIIYYGVTDGLDTHH